MKTKPLIAALVLAGATATAAAAGVDGLVGKSPSRLLKQDAAFAKTYRAAIQGQDLPDWTQRLAVGFPAEAVDVGGRMLALMSACNPQSGCKEERLYLLYAPAEKALTGFFFLPPNGGDPGDHRMALSRWIGKLPPKERSDFLLQRALQDAQDKAPGEAAAPPAAARD
ncbi:Ivy family c-type lysozyme inhibitor [Azospira restricta]|uniref:Inhibitor of vertebrate lysozyme n=1 Tax=Azospira restricta TaxID=404405 RepID=A0A974PVV5_9RHOO|nr:Ivy family c-type lysozyme inhibitor [Azospira restricta]QRJ62462.1 hypothetical protein IWH25_11775 [Azospira restricta]